MTDTPNPQDEIREAVARAICGVIYFDATVGDDEAADAAIAAHKRVLAEAGYVVVPRKLLERVVLALDDWLNCYAADQCDEQRVAEARSRIREAGGTLAYIADLQEAGRAAITKAEEEMGT